MNKLVDLGTKAIRAKSIKSVSKALSYCEFSNDTTKRIFKIVVTLYMGKQIKLEYETEARRDLKYKEIISIVNECSSDEQ